MSIDLAKILKTKELRHVSCVNMWEPFHCVQQPRHKRLRPLITISLAPRNTRLRQTRDRLAITSITAQLSITADIFEGVAYACIYLQIPPIKFQSGNMRGSHEIIHNKPLCSCNAAVRQGSFCSASVPHLELSRSSVARC